MERSYQNAAAEPYLPEHRPDAQKRIDGVIIDPTLRASFDQTDQEDRPQQEIDDWWNLPYIVTDGEEQYTVRCLDGGAWDRSTWRGTFEKLPDAIAHAKALIAQGGPVLGKFLGLRQEI